jgi:hypothetical protein
MLADIRLEAMPENCIFHISPMYEFSHSLGPGCVKKASYRHRAQNTASIGALNAIFLESIHRAPRDAPWGACCRRCDRRKSLAQAARASSRRATPRIAITRLML